MSTLGGVIHGGTKSVTLRKNSRYFKRHLLTNHPNTLRVSLIVPERLCHVYGAALFTVQMILVLTPASIE